LIERHGTRLRKLKLNLYYGTVKSATGGRHFMAWASSREHALNLVERRSPQRDL